MLIAKAYGAAVIAVDLLPARLELAATLSADVLVNAGDRDVVGAIREATRGRGADVAIDCSGAPAGQNAALVAVCKQGAVAFVGEWRPTQINPSDQIIRKLLTVIGGSYFPIGNWGRSLCSRQSIHNLRALDALARTAA